MIIPFCVVQVAGQVVGPLALGGALGAALSRVAPCVLASGVAAACASLLAVLSARQRATAVVSPLELGSALVDRMENAAKHADGLFNVGRVALGVAHDLNNHLATLSSNAEILLAQRDIPPDTHTAVREILASCDACVELTRGVLAIAHGKARSHGRLDMYAILRQTCAILERCSGRRTHIELRPGPGIAWVDGDKCELSNAFLNLGLNALDSMPDGGCLFLSASVVDLGGDPALQPPHGLRPGRYVRIRIRDNGGGIAAEHLPFIFEPFYSTKKGGTGIGLANVRDTVTGHGGAIDVESVVGVGTTFTVHLPCGDTR
jgi:signal transduction histidine kinase